MKPKIGIKIIKLVLTGPGLRKNTPIFSKKGLTIFKLSDISHTDKIAEFYT